LSSAAEGPYVGLSPFNAAQARYFFGRAIDSRIVANNVLTRAITVLYGPSGVGKSSVLQAGLPATLKRQFEAATIAPVRREWHDIPGALAWLKQEATTAARSPAAPHVLIMDQFEEYFLYRDRFEEAAEVLESTLAELIEASDRNIRLLFSLRDDGLHKLDLLRLWLPGILDNTIALDHLDDQGIGDAIERPVEVYNEVQAGQSPPLVLGENFAGKLIERLREAQEAAGQTAVALPYLQLVLQRLWTARRTLPEQEQIDSALLDELGGVMAIVRAHLGSRFDALTEGEQRLAGDVFHYLVTPSGGKFAYLPEDLAELASESADYAIDKDEVGALLQALAEGDARVLRESGGRFELFHDVLARPILEWRAKYMETAAFAYLNDVHTGIEMPLNGHGCLFGRFGQDADGLTPMAGRPVSRNHVLILRNGQILDLRSRYGTTVNARPVHFGETDTFLVSGDVIGFANSAAMTFRSVRDHVLFVPQETVREWHWGLLIDGKARLIRRLFKPSLYFGIGDDDRLTIGPRKPAHGGFAHMLRDDAGGVTITGLAEQPPLEVIEREDAYFDRQWVLEKGAIFQVELSNIEHPNPDTVAHVEGARRGVFRLGDRYFEIIVYRTIGRN
jgi:hypothetical protein